MSNKRYKSNWYIYVASFAVASVFAVMFMSIFWDVFFPERDNGITSGNIQSDLPDASNNLTVLLMLSEETGGVPDYYMIIGYRPAEEAVVCIPVRADLRSTVAGRTGTLSELYSSGGNQTALYAIENALGVECDNYVKLDHATFTELINMMGTVNVTCSYNVLDSEGAIIYEPGAHVMGGEALYAYITYKEESFGEDYPSQVLGSVAMSLINSNLRNLSSTVMQSYFSRIINITDTDLKFEDYTDRQRAFTYTSTVSYNPAQYYIPYGETEDNAFVIAENSRNTIHDRLGITE